MELLDRYLHTVKRHLPEGQHDDVTRELGENIRAQIEDRETELGRHFTKAELEELLKHHGAPILVASRYGPAGYGLAFGRQLIGPILFPYYVKVLALNAGIATPVVAAIAIALALPPQQALYRILWAVFWQFAVVTAIFCAVELHVSKSPEYWHVLSPFSTKGSLIRSRKSSPRTRRSYPRLEALSELIFLAVFFNLLRAVPDPILRQVPTAPQLYLAVLLLTAAAMVQAAICLIFPAWTRFRAWARVTGGVGWLAVLVVPLTRGLNRYVFWSLIVAVIVSAGIVLIDVRRLVRAYQERIQL
ncbi:MAG TPA: hypothetical protein VG096_10125 [Bryobacteraceae bacterium]|nr:hypothetical protein [Bryobacteraceae bacterium]